MDSVYFIVKQKKTFLKLKVTCALVSLFTEIRKLHHYEHYSAFWTEIKLEVNWLVYLLVIEFNSPKNISSVF